MSNVKDPSLKELLAIVGVDSVVWIDDDFYLDNPDNQRLRAEELLNQLRARNIQPAHPSFASAIKDIPEELREAKIQRVLDKELANLPAIIESLSQQVPRESESTPDDTQEFTPAQITALKTGLTNVQTLSYRDWQSRKPDLLPRCTENTLFLIDRDFKKERLGDTEGDGILIELQEQRQYRCIILTRTKTGQSTEVLRRAIVQKAEGKLNLSNFSVMSKGEVGATPEAVEREFCRACRVVFTHQHCHRAAKKLGQIMNAATDQTIGELINHSVYDLDRAIYENSLGEGASELDVLTRILLLQQRVAAQKGVIADLTVVSDLSKIRRLREFSTLSDDAPITALPTAKLVQWRREEVIDEADIVNRLHFPINCGDIFQLPGAETGYVLLVQPCDAMVRGKDGERNALEGIFVPFESLVSWRKRNSKKNSRQDGPNGQASPFHLIPNMEKDGSAWVFDFRHAVCVSLATLELAAFNDEGMVKLSREQKESHTWLPGLRRRFARTQSKLPPNADKVPKAIASISLNNSLKHRDGAWEGTPPAWVFKYKRTGHIRAPYAEAILGSFAAYHTRAAFVHDFTRGFWPEDNPPGDSGEKSETITTQEPGTPNAEAPAADTTKTAPLPGANPAASTKSVAGAAGDQKKPEEPVPAPKPEVQAEKELEPPKG